MKPDTHLPHTPAPFRTGRLLLAVGVYASLLPTPSPAQIRTDASLGRPAQTLAGPNYLIPQTLGKLIGNNLFHSFQTFNLKTGESALLTTTAANIANVISRVTGGEASTLSGQLRLLAAGGSAPSFFFINPAGVTFGAGASIDVPGAFYVSTANYVKFPEGNFYTDTETPSTFSSASPEAFGFLADKRASVQAINTNPAGTPGQPTRPSLFVGTDKSIHIVSGDVKIDNSVIGNESGDVRIVTLGRPDRETVVALTGAHPAAYGDLTIRNGGQINSSTNSNKDVGSVSIHAGNILIDKNDATRDTGIISQADRGASGRTGQMNIVATGDLTLLGGAKISAGNGSVAADPTQLSPGHMTILAKNITLDASTITADTRGNVDASSIRLTATGPLTTPADASSPDQPGFAAKGNLTLSNGASINGNTYLAGQGASIVVKAGTLTLDGGGRPTMIVASTLNAGAPGQLPTLQATGDGGSIDIAADSIHLTRGGQLQTSTITQGKAGTIHLQAGSLNIDGQNSQTQTGIFGTANPGSGGQAGTVDINLGDGPLSITQRGAISVQNDATVTPAQLAALSSSSLSITAGSLQMNDKALISASTNGNVEGSRIVARTVRNIAIDNGSAIQGSTSGKGDASSITLTAGGDLSLTNGAYINGNTSLSGNAASILISAANITLDGQGNQAIISSEANARQYTPAATGSGNLIDITTPGLLTITNGGQIKSSTNTAGNAGKIHVQAGEVDINGQDNVNQQTGIISTTVRSGNSGEIAVAASGALRVRQLGEINASAYGPAGRAGAIRIDSDSLLVDGMKEFHGNITLPDGSLRPVDGFKSSAITAEAGSNSEGRTGDVTISVNQGMKLTNGAKISVSNLAVVADPSQLNGLPEDQKPNLTIRTGSLAIDTRASIMASTSGNVDASAIKITSAGDLSLGQDAIINGSTSSAGKGASIALKAATLMLDGQGSISSISSESMPAPSPSATETTGNAGNVDISASRLILSNGGQIKTSTLTAGQAGVATIAADNILVDGANNTQVLTGIASTTRGTGDSGHISVTATKDFSLVRLGQINASTDAAGKAGSIDIHAGSVLVDGKLDTKNHISASAISAEAGPASSGKTGDITINARRNITLSRGGKLSAQNYANVSPEAATRLNADHAQRPRLTVNAPDITLIDSQISTASTGNVNASNIDIRFSNKLHLDPSSITTSANSGDGGAIDIRGGRLMVLDNSIVSTSVRGLVGFNGNPANGGDIHVQTDNLLLQTGFIQANTAASNASGGNVTLSVKNLVPSGNTLFLGGETAYRFTPYIFGFNAIQAAAPTGVSGVIKISAPTLDLAGALSGLKVKQVDPGGLGRSPCQASAGSSFVQTGRGGFAPSTRDLLGPQPASKPSPGESAQPGTRKAPLLSQATMECDQQ